MKEFKTGIQALRKLTNGKLYLIINGNAASSFDKIEEVEIIKAFGPHPVGNVSVSIEKFEPNCQRDRIWTVNPSDVATIGEFIPLE